MTNARKLLSAMLDSRTRWSFLIVDLIPVIAASGRYRTLGHLQCSCITSREWNIAGGHFVPSTPRHIALNVGQLSRRPRWSHARATGCPQRNNASCNPRAGGYNRRAWRQETGQEPWQEPE